MTEKKIPERRCVGCGEHFPKAALWRVVRTKEGEITFDGSGRLAGRGAYLCPNPECLRKAIKAHRLENAFGAAIPDGVFEKLEAKLKRVEGS